MPIGAWNTSSVRDVRKMFGNAVAFNQDIGGWDMSSVKDMSYMFYGATAFNMAIGAWNTSSATDVSRMFYNAAAFNQDIGGWDMSSVKDMSKMFYGGTSFNMPIGAWNTSSVTDVHWMFCSAAAFNQDIGGWDMSSVKNMNYMFYGATSFNMDIGGWNTSSVRDVTTMFGNAAAFNQDIGGWDMSLVKDMSYMFYGATSFNMDIGAWNTSSVTDMRYMFAGCSSFNQPLASWETFAVKDMRSMFFGASSFKQVLSTWNFSSIMNPSYMNNFASGSALAASACVYSHTSQALAFPSDLSGSGFDFNTCHACPCGDPTLACVQEMCFPVISDYIDLGRATWIVQEEIATAVGFRACAASCQAAERCLSFVLQDSGRCSLHWGKPQRSETDSGVTSLAFLKRTCQSFSCRPGTTHLPNAVVVSEATCCSCGTNLVPEASHKSRGQLKCVECPAGTEARSENCEACAAGLYAKAGAQCEKCGPRQIPTADGSDCERCEEGEFADGSECKSCPFPLILQDNSCILPPKLS